jgi:hypothetical protein
VLNHYNLFYQIQKAQAFNWDTCYHPALCLWLLPFHCLNTSISYYLETSGGQSFNLYLNVVHFFNTSVY